MTISNIYSNIPKENNEEIFEVINSIGKVKIERIVSRGQRSPDGFWYDQTQDEWVMMLTGSAGIRFFDNEEIVELKPGDYLLIPAHTKHRVEYTSSQTHTIWLAVHVEN
jgi:cupin 2 domain-containing protein